MILIVSIDGGPGFSSVLVLVCFGFGLTVLRTPRWDDIQLSQHVLEIAVF